MSVYVIVITVRAIVTTALACVTTARVHAIVAKDMDINGNNT
jgi:hypothetical protein